ncbi:ribose transport system substrate-binding protein [Rhodanobacter sp. ANJX3]|uniref:ribose ABC transporter substrate-binding protein RbsB n=1 Tax=unclassified Rhodanobacter TaxID=2621553 RepID=UPI0015CD95E2|nr:MULTISPECIES: ribose ABC transporter substrate-binding protein RbsB [unclassified Rhodanobacter]MBB5356900.1 ribose transport system substrate-binding protein [Rhodanobacter sp. ANJX3]NYE30810.1 ribose transport system substrate-binding protein [Rhodanobacter sp. K2T2]
MNKLGFLAVSTLTLLAAACSNQGPTDAASTPAAASTSPAPAASNKTIGLALSTQNNPFFVALKNGAQKEAAADGYTLTVVDAQDDPAKQISSVEDLIQKKVSVILLNPTDSSALAGAVKEANDAHIPVITLDRSVDGAQVVAHIASDNVVGGSEAAKFLIKALNNKGNVIELQGVPGTSAARDRGQGFDDEIKTSGLKIIAQQPANFDRAQGLSVTENLLQAHPDVQAIFAQNDEMALGAVRALDGAKRANVLVVGFDGTPDGIQAVKDGKIAAIVAQQPDMIGQLGVKNAKSVIDGEKVEAKIAVPLKLVTKDNAQ